MKTLVIGIGNPGRSDDGLGPALAEIIQSLGIESLETSIDYQLNIEHAAEIDEAGLVIFIDASVQAPPPFRFYKAEPLPGASSYTTHAMEPETVLATCLKVYGATPPAFVLAVRGVNFEIAEGLSREAEGYMKEAEKFLADLLLDAQNHVDLLDRCQAAAGSGE